MVKKQKQTSLDVFDANVCKSINDLDGYLRAEYNTDINYLEYYAGEEILKNVSSIKYQVIYGRRGTGKTHLLKALQESLLEKEEKYLPVYIDLRKYKPMLEDNNDLYYALIVFQEILVEILRCIYENVEYIYREYKADEQFIESKRSNIRDLFHKLNRNFDGQSVSKMGEVGFKISELKKVAASLNLSKKLGMTMDGGYDQGTETNKTQIKYISFSDMADILEEIFRIIDLDRVFCLLDEWSEIPENSQFILAEFIKRAFITRKITVKIAAIPNRTRLLGEGRIGLEDGGDIFGCSLDNRYIYELNPESTREFFNELLFKQLYMIAPRTYQKFVKDQEGHPVHSFINQFLTNQALREILIASAGIPRDFLNIFIAAYNIFYRSPKNRHIGVTDVRKATAQWYEVDKKKAVDANVSARLLLDRIIEEILISKKRCHFLVPEKYEQNKELNDLIDLRVIHLRKKGISHKDNKGVVYNVYYLDYACYTSQNLYHNRIITNLMDKIDHMENFRDIRRVSLEDSFFEQFNMQIGNSIKCSNCGEMVDVNHPAYVKQKICYHCYEKIE